MNLGRLHKTSLSLRQRSYPALWLNLCLLIAGFSFWTLPPAWSQPIVDPYQLKAVFLFNFTQFTEWPEEAFPSDSTPIIMGILGEDPFGGALDRIVENEVVNNRRLEVKKFQRVDEIDRCHLLFICDSESANIDKILKKLSGKHILTVGDSENFAEKGGVIQFYIDPNTGKIRLIINVKAVEDQGIRVSSKVLRLPTVRLIGQN